MRHVNAYLTHEAGISYHDQGYALEDGSLRADVVHTHLMIAQAMADAKLHARIATRTRTDNGANHSRRLRAARARKHR